MLRQQEAIADGKPNRSLADFVAPRSSGVARLPRRVRGDRRPRRRRARRSGSRREHDDYNAIMVKALADRLAEAFAEYLHARARRDWGYGATSVLDRRRSDCREVSRHPPGVRLSGVPGSQREVQAVRAARRAARRHRAHRDAAMMPAASVSGLYFAHPQARYFTRRPDRRGSDRRATRGARGMSIEEVERWLTPNSPTSRRAAERVRRSQLRSLA